VSAVRRLARLARGAARRPSAGGLPRLPLEEVVPGVGDAEVTLVDYEPALYDVTMRRPELVQLLRLARATAPRVVVELGTYRGGTALQLAANTDAEIHTLDLPPPQPWHGEDDPGSLFAGSPLAARIHQRLGDSRTHDFSDLAGRVDLVFVDASHEHDDVVHDSETALALLSPGGRSVWHDYSPESPGVVAALDALGVRVPLVAIAGTSLVVGPTPVVT
jgi:methyltransferase family protein